VSRALDSDASVSAASIELVYRIAHRDPRFVGRLDDDRHRARGLQDPAERVVRQMLDLEQVEHDAGIGRVLIIRLRLRTSGVIDVMPTRT